MKLNVKHFHEEKKKYDKLLIRNFKNLSRNKSIAEIESYLLPRVRRRRVNLKF